MVTTRQKLIQIHKKWGKETTKHDPSQTSKEETKKRQEFKGTAKAIRKQLNGNKCILTKNYFKCKWIGEGNGNPFRYFCLENSMDRGAWWATVHGVAESDTTEHTHTPCPHPCLLFFLIRLLASARTTFGTSSSGSSGSSVLPWRCCWCPLGNPDASALQRSPGRVQGSSRWPCTRFAPGLAPM